MEVIYLSKMRVYELAKELNISNKELIGKLNELGTEVKSHSSGVDDEVVEKVRQL
jgi:translation initiation factor IF-2